MVDKNDSDITYVDTTFSNIDSNLDEDEFKVPKEQVLGSIFKTEQCKIIRLMHLLEDIRCLDDALKNIILWTEEAFVNRFEFN